MGQLVEPVFLDGFAHGNRFGLWVSPAAGITLRGAILCVQPFGDEATLARRVLVAQARRLAKLGWTTLILDAFGTGDSAGETCDATLDQWRADLMLGASIARARAPGAFVLWGTRMGALLACEMLAALDQIVSGVVFWQPAPTGEGLLAPLMKLANVGAVARVGRDAQAVAGSGAGHAAPPDLPDLRDDPDNPGDALGGEAPLLNLGGYHLRRDLVQDLCALTMHPPQIGKGGAPYPVLMLGTQRILRPNAMAPLWLADLAQQWLDAGHLGSLRTLQGEPFWASLEPSTPVAVFEATEAFLANGVRA